jgi:hypothetical protein
VNPPEEVSPLELVLARFAVSDTVNAYATGIDMLQWDRFRGIFTQAPFIDFTSFSGGEAGRMPSDAWVERVASLQEGFDATQHISSNHVVSFQPDTGETFEQRATCVSYMQATHYIKPTTWVLGGYYTNELVRRPDGEWLIDSCTLKVTWEQGDRALATRAREKVAAGMGRTPVSR